MLIIKLNIATYICLIFYLAVNVYLIIGNTLPPELLSLKVPAILIRVVPMSFTSVCLYGLIRRTSWARKTVIAWNACLSFMIGVLPWIMYLYSSFLTGIKLTELMNSVNSTFITTLFGLLFISLCVCMRIKSVRENFEKREQMGA